MLKIYSKAEQITDAIMAHAVFFLDNYSYILNSEYVKFIALPLQQTFIAMLVTSSLYV
jgi:hypothetical protein